MDISPVDLDREYAHALGAWPYIPAVEAQYKLPPFTLFAVGSRETNLTNELGEIAPDGTRGHGVWQREDTDGHGGGLPAGFDTDVHAQALVAAAQLRGLLDALGGNLQQAADAYNEGLSAEQYNAAHGVPDAGTAHGDYGTDVIQRLQYLHTTYHTEPGADTMTDAQMAELKDWIWNVLYQGHQASLVALKAELDAIRASIGPQPVTPAAVPPAAAVPA